MCFYSDPDWYAEYSDRSTEKSDVAVQCDECRQLIPPGVTYDKIELRQHEECRRCSEGCYFPEDGFDTIEEAAAYCEAEGCHFGEEFECVTCGNCALLRGAIRAVEERDGCTGDEAEPPLTGLTEALWQSDHAEEYLAEAVKEYPTLAVSGYLDELLFVSRHQQMLDLSEDEDAEMEGAYCGASWHGDPDHFDTGGEG